MGSLMPGWDSATPGHAPTGFEDVDEKDQEPHGYFATYSKQKSLRRSSMDQDVRQQESGTSLTTSFGEYSLRRVSADSGLQRQGSERLSSDLQRRSSGGGLQLNRQKSLPNDFDIVMSPTAGSPSSKALGTPKSPHTHGFRWWSQLPSSILNEPPEEDGPKKPNGRTSNYMPQYHVTGQHAAHSAEHPSEIHAH